MLTCDRIRDVREQVSAWRGRGEQIVLVPTMGNLHAGHMRLVEAGRARGGRLIVSLFVNPTQFGPNEDFSRYPRTPERDARLLDTAGCDLLFQPDIDEMYPHGADSTRVEVPGLSAVLCGEFRPGHFEGVATVVAKLFNAVEPDVALFGEKDFQQLVVIRRMADDLCLRVEVAGVPTVRELDGLAMSSRNQYLSPDERRVAPAIHRVLRHAADAIAAGDRTCDALEAGGRLALERSGFLVDYFSVRDAGTLLPPSAATTHWVVLVAARLGTTRLIDNVQVRTPPRDT